MANQPLSPLEFVNLGSRLEEDRVEELGLTRLIEEARLVVDAGLRSLTASLQVLGGDEGDLKKALLGNQFRSWQSYGWRSLKVAPGGKPQSKMIPTLLSVVRGPRHGDHPEAKAVVVERRSPFSGKILVVGDSKPRAVYPNWGAAAKGAFGQRNANYWYLGDPDRIDLDSSLL